MTTDCGATQEEIRRALDRDLLVYKDWPREDESKAGGTARIVESIARSYACLGNPTEAKKYFQLAAKYCAVDIDNQDFTDKRPDHAGHHFFHCARKTWYASKKEAARSLFLSALDRYQDGYQHELEGVRITSRLYSAFSLIFISEYSSAAENAEVAMKLQETSEIPHPGTAAPTLKEIAELLAVRESGALRRALKKAKEYMAREKITEYGAGPHPIVDVKDYILSLIGGDDHDGRETD